MATCNVPYNVQRQVHDADGIDNIYVINYICGNAYCLRATRTGGGGGSLVIYDAAGNVVRKLSVKNNTVGNRSKRQVSSWDLTDRKGWLVSEGTYLVKGVLKTSDGKTEKVAFIVAVR